jgi:hypothetical protein
VTTNRGIAGVCCFAAERSGWPEISFLRSFFDFTGTALLAGPPDCWRRAIKARGVGALCRVGINLMRQVMQHAIK